MLKIENGLKNRDLQRWFLFIFMTKYPLLHNDHRDPKHSSSDPFTLSTLKETQLSPVCGVMLVDIREICPQFE